MAVYKLFPTKDATLYSLFPNMNTGLDEIVEATETSFAYSDPNPQTSRFLINFSETEIDYDKPYKDFNYSVSFLENFEKRQKQNYSDTSTEESLLEKFDLNE